MTNLEKPSAIVGLAVVGLIGPWFLFSAVLLHRYRETFVLRARGRYTPQLLNLGLFSYFFYGAVLFMILDKEETTCGAAFGYPLVFNAICTLMGLRVWVLAFRFRIAEKLTSLKRGAPLDSLVTGENSWFVRNRWMMTRRFLLTIAVISLGISTVMVLPGLFWLGLSCEQQRTSLTVVNGILIIVWALILFGLTRYIRKTDRDVAGLRTELRVSIMVAAATLIITFGIFAFRIDETTRAIGNSVVLVGVSSVFFVIIAWPLWVAMRETKAADVTLSEGEVATLADLLALDIGYESFLAYAKLEFAQENVLFWNAFNAFKLKYAEASRVFLNRAQCVREGQELIDQFITDNSPSQVNLASVVRNELLQAFRVIRTAGSPNLEHRNTHSHSHPPAAIVIPISSASSASSASSSSPSTATLSSSPSFNSSNQPSQHQPQPLALGLLSSTSQPNSQPNSQPSSASISPTTPPTEQQLTTALLTSTRSTSELNHHPVAIEQAAPAGPRAAEMASLTATLDIVNIFERAAQDIYSLMVTDILPRYIKSEQFVAFVRQMKERNRTGGGGGGGGSGKELSHTGDKGGGGGGGGGSSHNHHAKRRESRKDKDKDKESRSDEKHSRSDHSRGEGGGGKERAGGGAGAGAGPGGLSVIIDAPHDEFPDHGDDRSRGESPRPYSRADGKPDGGGGGGGGIKLDLALGTDGRKAMVSLDQVVIRDKGGMGVQPVSAAAAAGAAGTSPSPS